MNYELRMNMEESTNNSKFEIRNSKLRKAFTLVEMLVVIGIIAVLVGVSVASFSKMTKSADRVRAQELADGVATALSALFQTEGNWPKRLATNGGGEGQLDENAALPLARGGYFSLTTEGSGKQATKLIGLDRFGIVTPWATDVIKRRGSSASDGDIVSGGATVANHRLYYALDLDGDGIVEAKVGGELVKIRATAAVWSLGKSGGDGGKPWPYSVGRKKGDVYSWSHGQAQKVD